AQQRDRLEILVPAVNVGHPFARAPAVVEIQHRRHPVDAQSVDVVAIEPEEGAREQERAHLVASVVEDAATPFGMKALPRIGMLEEMRAVEVRETMLVAREMRGHPIEDHAESALVQVIDERHE